MNKLLGKREKVESKGVGTYNKQWIMWGKKRKQIKPHGPGLATHFETKPSYFFSFNSGVHVT